MLPIERFACSFSRLEYIVLVLLFWRLSSQVCRRERNLPRGNRRGQNFINAFK